jgi:predicted HicB family RNase H-like nuclease
MIYKGYEAQVYFSEDDNIFWGEVVNIAKPTTILFESQNAKNLAKEFHKSVDAYLDSCLSMQRLVKNLLSDKVSIQIDKDLHYKIKTNAEFDKISVDNYLSKIITDKRREVFA